MAKKESDIFEQLHKALGKHFLDRVRSGDATAAELKEARQFLRDNGIDVSSQQRDNGPLRDLSKELPFGEEEGEAPENIVNLGG